MEQKNRHFLNEHVIAVLFYILMLNHSILQCVCFHSLNMLDRENKCQILIIIWPKKLAIFVMIIFNSSFFASTSLTASNFFAPANIVTKFYD